MWGIISSIFLVVYLLIGVYIGRRGWSAFGQSTTIINRKIFWSLFAILFCSFPLAEVAQNYFPESIGFWLTMWGWYSMLAIIYIFFFVLIVDLTRLIDKRIRFVPLRLKENQNTPLAIGTLILTLVTFTLIYGSWNARNPIVTSYEVTINKSPSSTIKELEIAMVSDIHYGEIIDTHRLDKMVEIIKELKPDLILLAGDIIEGTSTGENAEKLINLLKKMPSKFGIFVVPGNHDRWARTDTSLLRNFEEAGIHVLKDKVIKIEESFYVIGRDDPGHRSGEGRKELGDLMRELDPSLPVILLDHQPIDLEKAQLNKVDLQLSGHTHMGQIFPSNLITGKLYELDWGLLIKDNYHLIVSSGYGTWGPPLRIGTKPEIVQVKMILNK